MAVIALSRARLNRCALFKVKMAMVKRGSIALVQSQVLLFFVTGSAFPVAVASHYLSTDE